MHHAIGFIALFVLSASFTSALTPAEYQAYIDEINAAAQSQKRTVSPTPVAPVTPKTTKPAPTPVSVIVSYNGSCPILSRNLSRGGRGADVSALQTFLISQKLLASDSATGYFGSLTEAAVRKWQASTGLASGGTPATTGYGSVGPKTRAAIALCGTTKTAATIPPTVTSASSQCTLYGRPTCSAGQHLVPGIPDTRGCAGPWQCIADSIIPTTTQQQCTIYSRPICSANERLVLGDPDSRGCAGPWQCVSNVSSQQCAIYSRPTCAVHEQLIPGTPDARGCAGPWQCVPMVSPASCPVHTQPACGANEHIEYGAPDANRCAGAPRCVVNSTTVGSFKSCTQDSITIVHGESRSFFSASSVQSPQSCSTVSQARTCTDGLLGGQASYQYASCSAQSVSVPLSCSLNGQVVAHGAFLTAYQSPTVPLGSSCVSQARACNNGTLSGSYAYSACTVAQNNVNAAVVTDAAYGAKGDCVTDDTVAFQRAVDAAYGPNGLGTVLVPATSACYLVGKVNGTNRSSLIVEGVGDQSLIKVNGSDSAGNWWDLSGSSNVTLKNLKVVGSGPVVPKTLFLWGNIGTAVDQNLTFNQVSIDAKSSAAHLYAFGYNGLRMDNGTWYQRENGSSQSDPSLRTSIVRLDNVNSFPGPVTSAHVTLGSGTVSWMTTLTHMSLIDSPSGYGNGVRDNNAAFICIQCGAVLNAIGGRMTGMGETPVVFWNFAEGIVFDGVTIGPTDQTTNTMIYAVRTGGSASNNTIGNLTLKNIFFTGSPIAAGAYIGTENPGTNGQVALGHFQLIAPDIGYNANDSHLMAPTGLACTAPVSAGWLINSSHIDANRMHMVFCGNANLSTTISDAPPPGYIITPAGTTQNGCKFRYDTGQSCAFD